jgi:hypothetical protein
MIQNGLQTVVKALERIKTPSVLVDKIHRKLLSFIRNPAAFHLGGSLQEKEKDSRRCELGDPIELAFSAVKILLILRI